MQSGSEGPPPPPRSAASPSSSSSNQLGLESQQQLVYKQMLSQQEHQQHQLRKAESEHAAFSFQSGGAHGIFGGSPVPQPSSAIHLSQPARKFNEISNQPGSSQLREGIQNKVQGGSQQVQNPIQEAYFQYAAMQAAQQKSQANLIMHQQGKPNSVSLMGRDQDTHANNLKMQELMSLQAAANQSQVPSFRRTNENFVQPEKYLVDQGNVSSDKKNDLKPPAVTAQLASTNMARPMQAMIPQVSMQNITNNQMAMAQVQAMQAFAKEHNIDLSVPGNVGMISQILPFWQFNKMAAQKQNETSTNVQQRLPTSKQLVAPSQVGNENSAHGSSSSDCSGQPGPSKGQLTLTSGAMSGAGDATSAIPSNLQMQQQVVPLGRVNQNERAVRPPMINDNGSNMAQMQYLRPLQQMYRPPSQPAVPVSDDGGRPPGPTQGGSVQAPQQQFGFTKQQLFVLKAQILAFRRLKRGERTLPPEVLQAIGGNPVDPKPQQPVARSGVANPDESAVRNTEEVTRHAADNNPQTNQLATLSKNHAMPKEEPVGAEEKTAMVSEVRGIECFMNDSTRMASNGNSERSNSTVKPEKDVEKENHDISSRGESSLDKGKALTADGTTEDAGQGSRIANSSTTPPPKDGVTRKYHGPLFDFQSFTRKNDLVNSATPNYPNSFRIAYDVKDLLLEEGKVITTKKRTESLKKINTLLAINLERKRIRPDLVVRLQIEERKLRLLDIQARLREEVEQQQQEIMTMPDRPYRKFVRQCERQRSELVRQVQQLQKASREKQLKAIFQWRKKLLEAHWAIRDARTQRNRGVAKYHERMLREFSKRKDDDRNKRMEALKNNDVDRYREILLEQQTNIPGDAAQRYEVLSSFLSQTEEYLYKLGGKITAAKSNQDVEDAANAAAAAARAQGLSEEEVRAAAACAGEEVMIRNRFSEMNAPKDSSSVNKYYNLAHAVTERVVRQPSLLRAGTLRDYQLVGLQWMLSLYNNKLNGILADEMGLGKTVQVMALIAYLMEFKGNYGPHLIIVPNAVLVNWKSELMNWLPSASCIFYVGGKDQRSKLFSQEVSAVKFNILVTTYEFIMYDRSKLSKIEWKYIIIDEAQRMKDRESVLARDLDRYRCQRRLLLTGTPLQNELKELWSLLNLLLPEVFDNRKAFHDWFSKPFQKDAPSQSAEEDDWLETEKKVIIIHRLHQILEPFMLRRRVEDVEGSLPPKVSIVLRCRMSAIQGAIYDWIRSTGTIRVDPEDEMRRIQKNSLYQIKSYKNLNNKCMELRKVCNHPLLNYPYYSDYSKEFIVRSCGKLWVLDRILIKLHRAGHRVLLFSTMTKLLDIIEEYLQWRRLVYRRIDGTTSLEDRESAIVDFNSPDSNCFIFLLSIRAAGRGLNLQTADTVVIYDPDPNPQNEEQAVARAHRIGQKREVKVIYMEAVVDKISSYRKEDEIRNGGVIDSEDDLAGKDRYIGSIESLIRNNIQQYKIDMANEVINAGRFDQRTTHEERRMTLETLLHDEERYQETVHDVPSMQEVNRMIARSEAEVELFDQMDEDLDWTTDMMKFSELPKWLRVSSKDVDAAVASLSKKPSKNILSVNSELEENHQNASSPGKSERRRGRPRASSANKHPVYRELDDSDDDLDIDSEERNTFDEDGDIGEFEEEELNTVGDVMPSNKDHVEEEDLVCDDAGFEISRPIGSGLNNVFEEAGSSGSSSGSRRLQQPETPSMSSRKFGSLSALDARPGSSKRIDELEEGEIAVSGDSHLDMHQSSSWLHGNEDGEDEQVLQPKLKRKRSIRLRPRFAAERVQERATGDSMFFQHAPRSHLKEEHGLGLQFRADATDSPVEGLSRRHEKSNSNSKQRPNVSSKKISPRVTQKSGRLSNVSGSADDGNEHSRESWSSKGMSSSGPSSTTRRMSDITQRKCKNVISKLQRRINKEGNQILPLLSDLWRRNENSCFPLPSTTGNAVLDLLAIEHRVDNLEYSGVPDFVSDVQLMLKSIVQHYDYSHEVKYEATTLRDIFFDIMKIAFPDSDFREARNAMTFSSPVSAATALSQKVGSSSQGKRPLPSIKIDAESVPSKVAVRKTARADDNVRTKVHTSKPQDTRLHGASGRELMPDCSQLLAHPGDLVISRKRRKDRDKSAIKQRLSPASPSAGRLTPISPPSSNKNVKGPSFQRSPHPTQQTVRPLGWRRSEAQQQAETGKAGSPNFMDVQWAKPVKRMRTDAGKRRPSNM